MNNDEVVFISREIMKKYGDYGYDYVYNVALKLFKCGIRLYMFYDDKDEIEIWKIVDYVLNSLNVVNMKEFARSGVFDNDLTKTDTNVTSIISFNCRGNYRRLLKRK